MGGWCSSSSPGVLGAGGGLLWAGVKDVGKGCSGVGMEAGGWTEAGVRLRGVAGGCTRDGVGAAVRFRGVATGWTEAGVVAGAGVGVVAGGCPKYGVKTGAGVRGVAGVCPGDVVVAGVGVGVIAGAGAGVVAGIGEGVKRSLQSDLDLQKAMFLRSLGEGEKTDDPSLLLGEIRSISSFSLPAFLLPCRSPGGGEGGVVSVNWMRLAVGGLG